MNTRKLNIELKTVLNYRPMKTKCFIAENLRDLEKGVFTSWTSLVEGGAGGTGSKGPGGRVWSWARD